MDAEKCMHPKTTLEEPPEGFGEDDISADPYVSRCAAYRAGVEQMLAYEQAGGDGWWKGWEMLKVVYNGQR